MPSAPLSSVRKAFELLDAFTPERTEISIRELARISNVPRSTTHRLVGELLEWGALEQGATGVRLGVKLFELGTMAPSHSTLREIALPYAHNLNEVTGLTVNLAVREGKEIVYVEKISTRALRVPHSRLGGRQALHATALGKAILAFSSDEAVADAIDGELRAITAKTIVDRASLHAELTSVHSFKVAYDVEESQPGLFCVAAPILNGRGNPLAAISVTGATALSQAEKFAPAVRTTAMAIARALQTRR